MEGGQIETQREIKEELNHYFAEILNKDLQDRERDIESNHVVNPSLDH